MKPANCLALGAALLALVAVACSMSSGDASTSAGGAGPEGSFSGSSGGGSATGSGSVASDSGAAVLPPETKTESAYQSPVATGSIVWTANPTSGRVAYVDAVTFDVQTVQAGDGPTYLAAVPSTDPNATSEAAIVLNVLSHDATLLSRDTQSGQLTPTTFPSTADANSWAMSPSGRWAIAWSDATRVTNPDPTQGFQDFMILDLTAGPSAAAAASVGYRPSQVVFARDESRVFAVTQDGISVIDLTAVPPVTTQNFPLSAPVDADAGVPDAAPDGLRRVGRGVRRWRRRGAVDAGSELVTTAAPTSTMPDVSFTPDGAFALVRQDGVSAITVVSLHDGTTTAVPLPSAPTDLTVAPDGTFAMAVLRDSATVAVLPLPGITVDPSSYTTTTIAGETIGRAVIAQNTPAGETSALLFTTVGGIDRLTVLTLGATPAYRTVSLHAPILAVFPTPDAENAIVLHTVTPTPGSTVKGAFSIVPVTKDLSPKIVSLTAPPTAVALSPTSDRALVTISDNAANFGVELAVMATQAVTPFTLASPPTAVGIAAAAGPDGTGFVAQDNADGRITFVDLSSATARTITGFELGARIAVGGGQ